MACCLTAEASSHVHSTPSCFQKYYVLSVFLCVEPLRLYERVTGHVCTYHKTLYVYA